MIKKTLYFGNPAYLSLRNEQLVIKLPEVEVDSDIPDMLKRQAEVTKPIEDIGVVVLDHRRITLTTGVLEALLANSCAVITCDRQSRPDDCFCLCAGIPHKTNVSASNSMLLYH